MNRELDLAKSLIRQSLDTRRDELAGKVSEISGQIAALKAAQARDAAIEDANKDALVNRLGIDRNSGLGKAIQIGASAVNTLSRAIGNTAALTPSFDAAINQGSADEADKLAYSRFKQGKASADDLARLNRVQEFRGEVQDPMGVMGAQAGNTGSGLTVMEALDQAETSRDTAQGIRQTMDLSGLVDQRDAIRMADQAQRMVDAEGGKLGNAWDRLTESGDKGAAARLAALGDLASSGASFAANRAKLIADNPWAVANAAPDAAMSIGLNLMGPVGAALNVAQTVGQAQDAYEQGIKNFREDKTANPEGNLYGDQKTLNRQALGAVGYVAAELLGDSLMTGAAKAGAAAVNAVKKPLVTEAAAGAASQVTNAAASEGFKKTLLEASKSVSKGAAKLYGAAEGEALSETASTIFEGMASNKEATGADLLVANATGFALGAGAPVGAAAGATAYQAAKTFKEAQANVAQQREEAKAEQSAVDAAVQAGTPGEFADPKSANYNPAQAINVLQTLASREGVTEDQRKQYMTQAASLVTELEEQVKLLDASANSDVQALTQERDAAAAAGKQALVDALDAEIAALNDPAQVQAVEEKRAQAQDRLTQAQAALTKAEESLAGFAERQAQQTARSVVAETKVEDLINQVATATAPAAVDADPATDPVQKLRLFTMASPTAVSTAQLDTVLKSPALSDKDRAYFQLYRDVQAAWEKASNMEQVSVEVLRGNSKNNQKGLLQYRERFSRFVSAGAISAARKEADGLLNFMRSHAAKYSAMRLAYEKAKDKGAVYAIFKQADGSYTMQAVSENRPRQKNELRIGGGSEQLIEGVAEEYRVMMATARFMSGMPDAQGKTGTLLDNKRFATLLKDTVASTAKRFGMDAPAPASAATTTGASNANQTVAPVADPVDPAAAPSTAAAPVDPLEEANALAQEAYTDADGEFAFDFSEEFDTAQDNGTQSNIDEQNEEDAAVNASIQQSANQAATESKVPSSAEGQLSVLRDGVDIEALASEQAREAGKDDAWKASLVEALTRLRQWIKQSPGSDTAISKRPLVMVENFIEKFVSGEFTGAEFLGEGIQPHQQTALAAVKAVLPSWMETLSGLLNRANSPENFAKTPAEFLMTGSGTDAKMDPNLLAGIAVGAMTWVAETVARGGLVNDDKTIAALTQIDEENVTDEMRSLLAFSGVRQNMAAQAIGKRVIQVMGFKPTQDAPKNLMPTLEAALGGYALELLVQRGLVERVSIKKEAWADATGTSVGEKDVDRLFFRLTRDGDVESAASAKVASLEKAFAGSGNVVQNLFGVEAEYVLPTFEPVAYTQRTLLKAKTKVPQFIARVLDKKNQEPNFLKMGMWSVVQSLYEGHPELTEAMAGTTNLEGVQATRRANVQAKNEGLARDLKNIFDFVNGPWMSKGDELKSPIYLQHTNWRNQRVGIVNGVMNPQASKIARHLIYRPDWQTKVDPAVEDDTLNNFRLRVLESFGVKTDKQSNAKSLAEWKSKVDSPEVQAAVMALKPVVAGQVTELSAEQAQAVAAAVKFGGENFKTLDALVALTEHDLAKEEGTTFTSTLVGEVDGVNNGPMLNQLLLGAAMKVEGLFMTLNKGGFFNAEQNFKAFNLFKDQTGARDLYEESIGYVINKITNDRANRKPWQEKKLQAVYAITGDFVDANGKVQKAGRDIIKRPINSLNFGSAVQTAVANMAEDFVDTLFKKIEKAADKGESPAKLIAAINELYSGKVPALNTNMTARQLLQYEFSAQELKLLRDGFNWSVGKPTEQVLSSQFSWMLVRRDNLVKNTNFMFSLYESAYSAMREGYLGELMRTTPKGQGIVSRGGKQQYDLSAGQESRLEFLTRKIAPTIHTAGSLASKSLASGISMIKWESDTELQDGTYDTRTNLNKDNATQSRMTLKGASKHMTGPGVTAASALIHSFDSYVSHLAAEMSQALNIHDAHVTGIGKFEEVARNLNQSLYQAVLEYSPAQEVYKAMERQVFGLVEILNDPTFGPDVKDPLIKTIQDAMAADEVNLLPQEWAKYLLYKLDMAKADAFAADQMRLGAAAEMTVVDQYALEGGAYEVTDADRAKAQELLQKLSKDVNPKLVEKLTALIKENNAEFEAQNLELARQEQQRLEAKATEFFGGNKAMVNAIVQELATDPNTPDYINLVAAMVKAGDLSNVTPADLALLYQHVQAVYPTELAVKEKQTPFGAVRPFNTISTVVDSVAQLLTQYRSAAQIAKQLGAKAQDPALRSILKSLAQALPPSTKVVMVTPEMDFSKIEQPDHPAAAWFNPNDNTIYVLSSQFDRANITEEMLTHEFVHAAVSSIIDNPKTPNQKKAVAQLDNILSLAQAHIASKGLDQFKHMVTDVHELLSWGMSNRDFQTQVLAQIPMVAQRKATFSNALKMFVQSIVELIVGADKAAAAEGTALADLLMAGTELIAQAKKREAKIVKDLVEGKTPGQIRTMAVPPVVQKIRNFTTDEVFAALSAMSAQGNSAGFTQRLQTMLQGIVTAIHGPFGSIKAQIEDQVGKTELDAWASALAMGQRPFGGDVLAAGLKFTAQEAFVAEQIQATMQHVLREKNGSQYPSYRQLSRLYLQAKSELKGKIPQDLYDFVFVNTSVTPDGRSDYLSRFVAISLAHEGMAQVMNFQVRKPALSMASLQGKTFLEAVEQIWRNLLDWMGAVQAGTLGVFDATNTLAILTRNLVQIEARAKDQITGQRTSALDYLAEAATVVSRGNAKASELIGKAKDKIEAAAKSDFVVNNAFALVKTAGAAVEVVAGNRVAAALTGLQRLYNEATTGKNNQAMQLLNYIKGPGQWLNEVIREAKRIEGQRKHIATQMEKAVSAAFKDGGAYLTDAQKSAVTQGLLRTGAHSLLDLYNTKDIQAMLESPKVLDAAIKTEIAKLNGMDAQHFYIRQAKGLGLMKITGNPGQHAQLQNAYAIARVMGDNLPYGKELPSGQAEQAEPVINRLIALYGLQYAKTLTPHDGRDLSATKPVEYLLEVLRTENNRGGENGIEVMLKIHKELEAQSQARLFADSPALMMHGYVPEVHTPRVKFSVVRTPDEARKLADQGYVAQGPVGLDPHDPDRRPGTLMVLKGVSLARWQSGGFSTTGTASRGTEKHNQYFSHYSSTGVHNMQSMDSIRAKELRAVAQQFRPDPGFDPADNLDNNYLIPLLNARGEVVEYRYMMSEQLRNTLLERDNRFEHLLGMMAASIYDKETSKANNLKLVKALDQHYQANVAKNPKGFVYIGDESDDPELREIWQLLPSATQNDVINTWGQKGMFVPKEMVTGLFGYRKVSAAQLWDKHPQALNMAQKAFVAIAEGLVTNYARLRLGMPLDEAKRYAQRTANVVRKVEQGAEEIVHEIKDIIVIKTLSVLWNNILSNMTLLWLNGINPIKSLAWQKEAWLAVSDYSRDREALDQLQIQLASGIGAANASPAARAELMAEISRLTDAIERNPAKELIDAGMLPTIVEDVENDDDRFSYKSALSEWVDAKTDKLPAAVKSVGRFMYMTHDTALYKFLSQTTQYSDFVGRYALYKHLTEGVPAGERLSKADALFQASESFVNYDIPMPRSLQYLDDMFVLPFLKYKLSIQRVLFRLFRDKPLNVINGILMNNALGDILPMVTDSSLIASWDTISLKPGAAELPSVLDDLATVELATGMFK